MAKAEELFGVTETEPIDFYVYASQAPFYDALGPGTRERERPLLRARSNACPKPISSLQTSWPARCPPRPRAQQIPRHLPPFR